MDEQQKRLSRIRDRERPYEFLPSVAGFVFVGLLFSMCVLTDMRIVSTAVAVVPTGLMALGSSGQGD